MIDTELGEIGQIAITVRDLERSKAFYRDVLGLRFLFDAGAMAFFQCGSVRVMLGLGEGKEEPMGGTVLYFKVGDLQGARAALGERGAVFSHEPHLVAKMPDHDLWMAFLKDPDGNAVGVMSEVGRG